jgi:GMP synthase-like glutamine amidotransferase
MRVHCYQHVPYEPVDRIEGWARANGHEFAPARWYAGEIPVGPVRSDLLVIMGGPMSVHDEAQHPWLAAEKRLIDRAIAGGTRVFGICLGAQLLADRLGASVTQMPHPEIGWFPIRTARVSNPFAGLIVDGTPVFHWHGETFDLPAGSTGLASSEACPNQGFSCGDRILALQFHLEMTRDGAVEIIESCGEELTEQPTVQSAAAILADSGRFEATHPIMAALLDHLAAID